MGPLQLALRERASRSACRYVVPRTYLERRALRRLRARGMAARVWGWPDLWRVK